MTSCRPPASRHRAPALAAVAAVAVVGLAACSNSSSGASAATTSAAATTSTSAAATSAATSLPSATQASSSSAAPTADLGQIVAITVAGGKVTGPQGRVKVAKDATVTLRVTSDVADEIHLHGYDKKADVPQGGTADLTFRADLTGVFEVELEQHGLQLTQLQVQ